MERAKGVVGQRGGSRRVVVREPAVESSVAKPVGSDVAITAAGADQVVRMGVWLTIAAVAFQTACYVLNGVFDLDIGAANLDADNTPFSWASTAATFAVAYMALLLAGRSRARRRLVAASAIVAFLSMDDMLALHERLSESVERHSSFSEIGRIVWPILFLPGLAFVFFAFWTLARPALPRAALVIRGGLILLALGVGLEMASSLFFAAGSEKGSAYHLEVALEEGCELAGWMLLATGVTSLGCTGPLRSPWTGEA